MSTPQVIHHTDYRSKTEDRKRELEKLQKKGLTKTQGKSRKHCNNADTLHGPTHLTGSSGFYHYLLPAMCYISTVSVVSPISTLNFYLWIFNLLNPGAAQLRDAPVPKEACNFLKKQRELFEERRKKQADAIDFLHQFRWVFCAVNQKQQDRLYKSLRISCRIPTNS